MNILFVTSNFPPMNGGIAVFNYRICKELFAQGHRVSVVAYSKVGSDNFDQRQKFKIRRLNGRIRPTSMEAIYKILSATIKEKIDLIFYGHFGSSHWISGVLAQRIFNVPYLVLVHGRDLNQYLHRFAKTDRWTSSVVLKNAAQIIANSRTTKKLVEDHGYPPERTHIVNPGTNPEIFNASNQCEEIRKKYRLTGKKVLLTVSNLVAIKNHTNVLKALPEVIKQIPNLVYLIIGEGVEKKTIRRIVDELSLQSYVKLLGHVEQQSIAPYYHSCDVFIMPSRTVDIYYESFGIVYTEANACGKPVIAGRPGGIEDAVIDGVTGLIVDPENINEISRAIIRLFMDEKLARRLGENGRRRVEKDLNWGVIGKKLNEVITKAVCSYRI